METTDETYFKMFDRWPCNTFKPASHVGVKSDKLYVVGAGICEGYAGFVRPRREVGEWTVFLSCGAKWSYHSLAEMIADWRIARTFAERHRGEGPLAYKAEGR